jgi:hypothetical protein
VSGMRADITRAAGNQDFGHLEGRATNGTLGPHHNCTILIRGPDAIRQRRNPQ